MTDETVERAGIGVLALVIVLAFALACEVCR